MKLCHLIASDGPCSESSGETHRLLVCVSAPLAVIPGLVGAERGSTTLPARREVWSRRLVSVALSSLQHALTGCSLSEGWAGLSSLMCSHAPQAVPGSALCTAEPLPRMRGDRIREQLLLERSKSIFSNRWTSPQLSGMWHQGACCLQSCLLDVR